MGGDGTRNRAPVAAAHTVWRAELAAVHVRTCTCRDRCKGMRNADMILQSSKFTPAAQAGENAWPQCEQAIEAEELLHIVYHGAEILPRGKTVAECAPFEVHNYPASEKGRQGMQEEIEKELAAGILREVTEKPAHITALSVKEETDKIRVIRDCSAPEGGAVNTHVDTLKFTMMNLRDAQERMRPGWYMAKVDIKAAFRTIGVLPEQQELLGFKYSPHTGAQPRYFIDQRLPFGMRNSPEIFCRISTAVRAMMVAKGYEDVVVYVDDFLLLAPTEARCKEALDVLLALLEQLGFTVSAKKTVQPTQEIIFLGMLLRTNADGNGAMSVTVPEEKMRKAESTAAELMGKKLISVKQAQKAVGYFVHLCHAIYAAKCFTKRILQAITAAEKAGKKWIEVDRNISMDLSYWVHHARNSNGTAVILQKPRMLQGYLATDASDWGMGGFFNGRWFSVRWDDLRKHKPHRQFRQHNKKELWPTQALTKRELQEMGRGKDPPSSINYREQFAQWWAILLWGVHMRAHTMRWHQDNSTVVGNIRRMGAKNPHHMRLLRHLFKVSAAENMRHEMIQVPSEANSLADPASRGAHAEFAARLKRWRLEHTDTEEIWEPPVPRDPPLMEQRAKRWLSSGGGAEASEEDDTLEDMPWALIWGV